MKNLQQQLSNGNWVNVSSDDMERFLAYCDANNGPDEMGEITARCCATRDATRNEVLAALESGKTLRNDASDWYSNCRYEPAPRPVATVELVKCSCGHSVPKISVMSTSTGSSCPDCYDRMSE